MPELVLPPRLAAAIWRNVWQTADGRRVPGGPPLEDPGGEGWSSKLEPGPEPNRWTPVAAWDLPERHPAEPEPPPEDPRPLRPVYCGRFSVMGPLRDEAGEETGELGVARIMCRCYRCPICGPRKGRRVRDQILRAVEKHRLCRMLTLTLDPKRLAGMEPHAFLKRCFNRLRYRWQKVYPNGVEYVAVVEHHKSGMPHLHVAVSRFLPQGTVRRWWMAAGGGAQVWISWRDPGRAGRYIGKYMGKQLARELAGSTPPLRSRRVQTSRGVRLAPPKEPSKGWRRLSVSIDQVAASACLLHEVLAGLVVYVEDAGRWLRFLTLKASEWWQLAFLLGVAA